MTQQGRHAKAKSLTPFKRYLLAIAAGGGNPAQGLPYKQLGQLQSLVNRGMLRFAHGRYLLTDAGRAALEADNG